MCLLARGEGIREDCIDVQVKTERLCTAAGFGTVLRGMHVFGAVGTRGGNDPDKRSSYPIPQP